MNEGGDVFLGICTAIHFLGGWSRVLDRPLAGFNKWHQPLMVGLTQMLWVAVFFASGFGLYCLSPGRTLFALLLVSVSAWAWADAVLFVGVRAVMGKIAALPRVPDWEDEAVPILAIRFLAFALLAGVAVLVRPFAWGDKASLVTAMILGAGSVAMMMLCLLVEVWFQERRKKALHQDS